MFQHLPSRGLKLNPTVQEKDILNRPGDSNIGDCREGDLEIPEHLHDKFKEFPPCPESLTPQVEWLSGFQKSIMNQNNIHPNTPSDETREICDTL